METAPAPAPAPALAGGQGAKRARGESRRLRIVHFNDVYNVQAAPREHVCGGAARFVSLLKSFRRGGAHYDAAAGEPLVLFSGDAFNPSVMSTVTRGKQMPPVLNAMGIACACYGNHDFDFGVDALLRLKGACDFPWLISNVADAHDAEGGRLADGLRAHVVEVPGGGGGEAAKPRGKGPSPPAVAPKSIKDKRTSLDIYSCVLPISQSSSTPSWQTAHHTVV